MKSLKQTAIAITLISVLVKVSGFIRESIIVKEFGANEVTDGYFLAFSFILLVITLIATGFNNIFLPLYVKNKHLELNEHNASSILNYTVLTIITLSVIGYFTAQDFVPFIFNEMHPVTEKITIELTKIFMVFLVVIVVNNILESYLQAKRIFVPSQFAKLFAAIFTALFAILFSHKFGIVSLAYGLFIGSIFGAILQLYYLFKTDFKWLPSLKIEKTFRNTFLTLLLPALLYSIVGQINVFVDKIFATNTVSGAITYLNNASLIMSIPGALFATTIGSIIFTLLSEQSKQHENFQDTFVKGAYYSSVVLIPITFSIFIIGHPLISFIYERGLFTSIDSDNTTTVLLYYAPLIFFQGIQLVVSKSLYAKGKVKTIFIISATTILLNVVLNAWFVKFLGYPGLALSSTLVALYYYLLTSIVLMKDFDKRNILKVVLILIKVVVPSSIMASVMYLVMIFSPISTFHSLIQLILYSLVGLFVYMPILFFFFPEIKKKITSKFKVKINI